MQIIDNRSTQSWLKRGRIVEIADSWAVTIADTPENQSEYPQMVNQNTFCGFPLARIIGLSFLLATGAANRLAIAVYQGQQAGDSAPLRFILRFIPPGRVWLSDCYYASF